MNIKFDISECVVKIANKCNGRIFGGYLRDFYIPRLKDPHCKADFKDVDIWFVEQEYADLFINQLNEEFVVKENSGWNSGSIMYTFNRKQYVLQLSENYELWIDIIVSKNFPVNDFDVNCFTYYDGELHFEKNNFNIDDVIENIHKKELNILPEYINKLCGIERKCEIIVGELLIRRIIDRFIIRGWKIKYNNKYLYENPSWWTQENIKELFFKSIERCLFLSSEQSEQISKDVKRGLLLNIETSEQFPVSAKIDSDNETIRIFNEEIQYKIPFYARILRDKNNTTIFIEDAKSRDPFATKIIHHDENVKVYIKGEDEREIYCVKNNANAVY